MAGRTNSIAFTPANIGNANLKNRLVRSASHDGMATAKGVVTERQVELYRSLAEGGVGLIITGATAPHASGASLHNIMRLTDDSFIPSIRRLARAVHEVNNGCRIMLQLVHQGRQSYMPGYPVLAPSAVFDSFLQRTPRELTTAEIDEIVQAFAEGVRRAREAEFDGVQLHAAHEKLLSNFLSPHINCREDAYGGSTEKRVRILKEIFDSAVSRVGKDFPITIKINSDDCFPGGVDPQEAVEIARHLEKIGFSAIEVSGGIWEALTRSETELGWKPVLIPEARVGINRKEQEAYFWDNARQIARAVSVPVILVGGIKSIDKIEEILEEGSVSFCAMCRPLIRQPDLPNLWLRGGGGETATCISCNKCILTADGLRCRAKEKSGVALNGDD
jgi:2,4-dienoyl-CoA reductase-like NADH-dependent reductase (Old Yellow Enzyme family)